jgi:hypothetical protein
MKPVQLGLLPPRIVPMCASPDLLRRRWAVWEASTGPEGALSSARTSGAAAMRARTSCERSSAVVVGSVSDSIRPRRILETLPSRWGAPGGRAAPSLELRSIPWSSVR